MLFKKPSFGLYLATQPSENFGIIKHYGVVDVGNVLGIKKYDGSQPIVIHQTPPRVSVNLLRYTGKWDFVGKVIDLHGARKRLIEAIKNPRYDLFGNNCEHFARFITQNQHTSYQVNWGVSFIGSAVVVYSLFKKNISI